MKRVAINQFNNEICKILSRAEKDKKKKKSIEYAVTALNICHRVTKFINLSTIL